MPILCRTRRCVIEFAKRAFSSESLMARMEAYIPFNHAKMCVAIAGGGGTFLSCLASIQGASKMLLSGDLLYSRAAINEYTQQARFKGFCTPKIAETLADSASARAVQQSLSSHVVGIGCTSRLSSEHRKHASRAFVNAKSSKGWVALSAKLAGNRSRYEEDLYVGGLMQTSLEVLGDIDPHISEKPESFDPNAPRQTIHSPDGDEIEIQREFPSPTRQLESAAEAILSGKSKALLVLPDKETNSFLVLNHVRVTPNTLLLPGSFNPPHIGHVELAGAASKQLRCETVLFELSLTNVAKPKLETSDVVQRIEAFRQLDVPFSYGIVLTNSPFFEHKLEALHQTQTLPICMGADTLMRITDPSFYESEDAMIDILSDMNCRFIIGGRLQQNDDRAATEQNGVFESGQSYIDRLPRHLQRKFSLINDFRVDLSSTEIRQNHNECENHNTAG